VIDIKKMWDKLILAARVIAAIENPADVCVVSSNTLAQRALLKFAAHTGATPIFGRFVPGSLTNQIQKNFKEPRLLVVSDPRADHQAVTEASFVNVPVISFCNTDTPMKFIDVAIPCNNKNPHSIGLMWWLLAREVLYIKGKILREIGFVLDGKTIMADLYFYRDPQEQEQEKEEQEHVDAVEEPKEAWGTPQVDAVKMDAFPVAIPVVPAAPGARGPVRLDFQVPNIEDWAEASTFDQHGAIQNANASGGNDAAPKEPKDDWGTGTSGW